MPELAHRLGRWAWDHHDAVTAAVLTAAAAGVLAANDLFRPAGELAGALCTLGVTALVAGRRRWPVASATIAGVLLAAPDLSHSGREVFAITALTVPAGTAMFLLAYALGSYCPWRRSLVGLVPLTVGLALTTTTFNPFLIVVTVGPWLGGLVVASRRWVAEQLEVRARELEEEQAIFAEQSVRYERTRIARELHDIVAHGVSMMVVQAGAGEHLAAADPEGAREAFDSISEAAQQAETEIDRLVEFLDTTSPPAAPTGPRTVGELVRQVRVSGLRASFHLSGDGDDLAGETAETAYRVVQEAVTNAMKHAPGTQIDIGLRGAADSVELVVANGPAPGPISGLEASGGGHGLAGMRERVARCGGTFGAGPTPEGGWRVAATLPRRPPASVSPQPRGTVTSP